MLRNFLIWVAGSDQKILNQCDEQSDSEQIKHAGFGALILVPAIMGFISMSYAISTIIPRDYLFKDSLTILFGFIWALIILSIDRFIVSTYRKSDSIEKDLKSWFFITRLIFATAISIIVAHPIVMFIFKETLQEEVIAIERDGVNKIFEEYDLKIDSINRENSPKLSFLDTTIVNKEALINEWRRFRNDEWNGVDARHECCGPTSGKEGPGRRKLTADTTIIDLKIIRDSLVHEKSDLLEYQRKEITNQTNIRDSLTTEFLEEFNREAYFIQNEALHRLENQDGGSFITTAKWFLILFFILLDVLPVLWKAMTKRGEYDKILDQYDKAEVASDYITKSGIAEVIKHYKEQVVKAKKGKIQDYFDDWDGANWNKLLLKIAPHSYSASLEDLHGIETQVDDSDEIFYSRIIEHLEKHSYRQFAGTELDFEFNIKKSWLETIANWVLEDDSTQAEEKLFERIKSIKFLNGNKIEVETVPKKFKLLLKKFSIYINVTDGIITAAVSNAKCLGTVIKFLVLFGYIKTEEPSLKVDGNMVYFDISKYKKSFRFCEINRFFEFITIKDLNINQNGLLTSKIKFKI